MPEFARQLLAGARTLVALTVILGLGYPLLVLGVTRLTADQQRQGSLINDQGRTVGSALIGQSFPGERWFQPRPSAGGYDAQASGGSNLGPTSAQLQTEIEQRRAVIAARENVAPTAVPPDAVTASASGLDPDISPAYAQLQVPRVARVRGLSAERVSRLVAAHTQGRTLGFLGQPRVNVVELNRSLIDISP